MNALKAYCRIDKLEIEFDIRISLNSVIDELTDVFR